VFQVRTAHSSSLHMRAGPRGRSLGISRHMSAVSRPELPLSLRNEANDATANAFQGGCQPHGMVAMALHRPDIENL
jgi:hypothetical protein